MGFSAYGITQEGDDPLTKAFARLIDHALLSNARSNVWSRRWSAAASRSTTYR